MEKVKDSITGFELIITDDKLKIEMPITNLVRGFNLCPDNYDEVKIKKGMRKEFIEWLAENLIDDADTETGDNFISTMLDSVFQRAYEDYLDFVKYPDDEE